MKQNAQLMISPELTIPVTPQREVLKHHSTVINDGVIIDILPTDQALEKYDAQESINLPNHVILPGLINAHGHSSMSLFKGYANDLPLMEWLENHIWPAEQKFISSKFVRQGTEIAIAEMLLSGTTCFSDMYFFPNECAHAVKTSGIRSQIAFPIFNVPSAWGNDADTYIKKGLELVDLYRNDELITIAFGPHAPYTNDDATLSRIATLSNELDASVQMHVHETAFEVSSSMEQYNERPIQRLDRLGLLSSKFQAVHCTQLNDLDISLLSSTQSHVIHCPESNLKLASGFCDINKLFQNNINVSLGTDGSASNNDLDMFSELRTASLLAKGISLDSEAVNAYQSIEMATINGAKALNIDHITGSLEPNKHADIIALNLDNISALPSYDTFSTLCYSNCSSWVTDVWVKGKQLVKNKTLQTLDVNELKNNARSWHKRISN
jgi:5-methylthioadenosine/S-adenosylhomocysteine deaminase